MAVEGTPAGEKVPFVELYPWQTRTAVIKEVTTPGTDEHRVVKVRIPAGARNGQRLRLVNGPTLRMRLLVWRTVLHLLVAAAVLLGVSTGSGGVSLLFAAAWLLLLLCRRHHGSPQRGTSKAS